MKIRLAILEKDKNYLHRLVSVFETKYASNLEIYSFTDLSVAMSNLENAKIDVFLANDAFDIDTSILPKRCGFAYFVDSADIIVEKEHQTICKFQRAEQIYKQILSLYSEIAGDISGVKLDDEAGKVIIFSSPCGGVGTSTMAAACAIHFAAAGKRTLYLNLEDFGVSDIFFSAEGQFDMSDVIFSLKSKKTNLTLKLESSVKQDASGVYFFSPSKIALDMLELTAEEIMRLISELQLMGFYDYIVVDMDFVADKDHLQIYKIAQALVWVGDGSEISNSKIFRCFSALSLKEQNEDYSLLNRCCLVYNKFSNKTGKIVGEISLKNIGGAPRYEHASVQQILTQLAPMDIFNRIV